MLFSVAVSLGEAQSTDAYDYQDYGDHQDSYEYNYEGDSLYQDYSENKAQQGGGGGA